MKLVAVFFAALGLAVAAPNSPITIQADSNSRSVHPILNDSNQVMRQFGANIENGLKIFKALVHREISPRSLNDDFNELLALFPVEDIREIVNNHLANDGALAAVIEYLKSPEWDSAVTQITEVQGFKEFNDYLASVDISLEDVGAAVYNAINSTVPTATSDPNRDLNPFLNEILQTIPFDDLANWFVDKVLHSIDFQIFLENIPSQETGAVVTEIRAIPEVQNFEQLLEDVGLAVQEFWAVTSLLLNWSDPTTPAPTGTLGDDLMDFIRLVPSINFLVTFTSHYFGDSAFAVLINFLKSEEWTKTFDSITKDEGVQSFAEYLQGAGIPLDVIGPVVGELLLNVPPLVNASDSANLDSFFSDIEAVLPLDDFEALLADKIQNSKAFGEFYARLSNDQSHATVARLLQLSGVQHFAQVLKRLDVKVDETLKAIYGLFGWGNPPSTSPSGVVGLSLSAVVGVISLLTVLM